MESFLRRGIVWERAGKDIREKLKGAINILLKKEGEKKLLNRGSGV
jgi:hypothetical protein